MLTPEDACDNAEESGGTPELRAICCKDPYWAYEYALNVDKVSRDDTRKAACGEPQWAYDYALDVDRTPRDDTRTGASTRPSWAYLYARNVDKIPCSETYKSVLDSEYQEDYEKNLGIPKEYVGLKDRVKILRSGKIKKNGIIC